MKRQIIKSKASAKLMSSLALWLGGGLILFFVLFQNCAKVQFSPEELASTDKITNQDLVKAVDPVTYVPPVTPAAPVHGDIVGTLKPFTIEAQKVVPKTKMVIVVDNSGSMKNSQENLAKGIDSMLVSLQEQIQAGVNPNVEFYIVTTTIPQTAPRSFDTTNQYNSSGVLFDQYSFYGNNWYINPVDQFTTSYPAIGYLSVATLNDNNARLTQMKLSLRILNAIFLHLSLGGLGPLGLLLA